MWFRHVRPTDPFNLPFTRGSLGVSLSELANRTLHTFGLRRRSENMKMGTATAVASENGTNVGYCVEKILKIAQEVEHEIKDREANFQAQLRRAIEETRQQVEEQGRAELERAVSQAKERTRREVTDQLLTRFHFEITRLEADFARRASETAAQAEAQEQLKIETAVAA